MCGKTLAGLGAGRHPIGVETLTRATVFERYAVDLTRFATGLVGPSDAQDVVSEAVLRSMWSNGWPDVRNPRAYLYQAVLFQSRMHHRSAMRRRARETATAQVGFAHNPELSVEVWDALARLNVVSRGVVFLTYWEGLTCGEVGGRLGLSERTVRRHLERARARLRGILR